jgi:hypothetical protein
MSNILVHKKTGEVIHIDFGVVFEQGMVCHILIVLPRLIFLYLSIDFISTAIDSSGDSTLSTHKKRH